MERRPHIDLLPPGIYVLTENARAGGWVAFHLQSTDRRTGSVTFIERFGVTHHYRMTYLGMRDWPSTMIGMLGSGKLARVPRDTPILQWCRDNGYHDAATALAHNPIHLVSINEEIATLGRKLALAHLGAA